MRASHDIIVVGGGLAGLTAAHHARLMGADVVCLEGELPGGFVVNVGAIDGYPSAGTVAGADLASALVADNRRLGVDMRDNAVLEITLGGEQKSVRTAEGTLAARQLILATGARLKRLGIEGEETLRGRGVSQCAFCDAGFFKAQDVVVIGGGDAALQEALHLAEHCRTVTLVHRRNRLRARRHYVARAADHDAFRFRWDSVAERILGDDAVTGVTLRHLGSGETETIACAGVFIFVGLAPNTEPVPDGVERDADGALVVNEHLQTSAEGVFAVGAVRSGYGGRLTQAVSDGTTAAAAAVRNL